jgi:hypothetical protein
MSFLSRMRKLRSSNGNDDKINLSSLERRRAAQVKRDVLIAGMLLTDQSHIATMSTRTEDFAELFKQLRASIVQGKITRTEEGAMILYCRRFDLAFCPDHIKHHVKDEGHELVEYPTPLFCCVCLGIYAPDPEAA